jgi:hypothetical protein
MALMARRSFMPLAAPSAFIHYTIPPTRDVDAHLVARARAPIFCAADTSDRVGRLAIACSPAV